MKLKILIATSNAGKVSEFEQLASGIGVETVGLSDFPEAAEVEENGKTFADNARLKARGYALQTGLHALADDSGLEVDGLDGRPGVLSARYGGPHLGFPERMQLLLDELKQSGSPNRSARFSCAIAIAAPDGSIIQETAGICPGRIADASVGDGGFGYDPIFIPEGYSHSFGELDALVKGRISHRARAFEQIIPFLRDYMAI